jgi:hypothetical protein
MRFAAAPRRIPARFNPGFRRSAPYRGIYGALSALARYAPVWHKAHRGAAT